MTRKVDMTMTTKDRYDLGKVCTRGVCEFTLMYLIGLMSVAN